MEITPDQFNAVCYLVLMDHHGAGYINAHPSYIAEKLSMLNAGYDAYSYLDRPNQLAVLNYLNHWKYNLPKPIQKYEDELKNINIIL